MRPARMLRNGACAVPSAGAAALLSPPDSGTGGESSTQPPLDTATSRPDRHACPTPTLEPNGNHPPGSATPSNDRGGRHGGPRRPQARRESRPDSRGGIFRVIPAAPNLRPDERGRWHPERNTGKR